MLTDFRPFLIWMECSSSVHGVGGLLALLYWNDENCSSPCPRILARTHTQNAFTYSMNVLWGNSPSRLPDSGSNSECRDLTQSDWSGLKLFVRLFSQTSSLWKGVSAFCIPLTYIGGLLATFSFPNFGQYCVVIIVRAFRPALLLTGLFDQNFCTDLFNFPSFY